MAYIKSYSKGLTLKKFFNLRKKEGKKIISIHYNIIIGYAK